MKTSFISPLRGFAAAASLIITLAASPAARADLSPAEVLTQIENAVTEAQRHLSPAARKAHDGDIDQALANIRQTVENLSRGKADLDQADATITRRSADVEAVDNEMRALKTQHDSEAEPLERDKQAANARGRQWNASYGGKTFQTPEPYNSLEAQRQQIDSEIAAVNQRIDAFNEKYSNAEQQLIAKRNARLQDYQDAVKARDELDQSLRSQIEQFKAAIQDLSDKLDNWAKESAAPATRSALDPRSGTLDQLRKAANQRTRMSDPDKERSEKESTIVFDRRGGDGGALPNVPQPDVAAAPVQAQQNPDLRALDERVNAAQATADKAKQEWERTIHERGVTRAEIMAADKALTKATTDLVWAKHEEKAATDVLGRTAAK